MDIKDITHQLDIAYKKAFSTMERREWGDLFWNLENPTHYDANHAHIFVPPHEPERVIKEVVSFYQEKKIIPRFYLYNPENNQVFISQLESHGFAIEDFVVPIQLWNGKITESKHDIDVKIEMVTEHNYAEALHVECSISEFGGREVREKAFELEFHHPSFQYYLLKWNDTAIATACVFQHGEHARLENVATVKAYRGQGFIGGLIRYIQQETRKKGIAHFWVSPINEQVEKVYQRYGFETIGHVASVHGFMGGKSFKEIHQG